MNQTSFISFDQGAQFPITSIGPNPYQNVAIRTVSIPIDPMVGNMKLVDDTQEMANFIAKCSITIAKKEEMASSAFTTFVRDTLVKTQLHRATIAIGLQFFNVFIGAERTSEEEKILIKLSVCFLFARKFESKITNKKWSQITGTSLKEIDVELSNLKDTGIRIDAAAVVEKFERCWNMWKPKPSRSSPIDGASPLNTLHFSPVGNYAWGQFSPEVCQNFVPRQAFFPSPPLPPHGFPFAPPPPQPNTNILGQSNYFDNQTLQKVPLPHPQPIRIQRASILDYSP